MDNAARCASSVLPSLSSFSFGKMNRTLKMHNLRWKLMCALSCLIVALMLLGISLFATLFLEFFIERSIASFVVVDSTSHDRYDEWEDNTVSGAIPLYVDVYFWNLSNLEDIRANATVKPEFVEVGPFSYRKYYKKINVTFLDRGNQVSYDRWTYYVEQPNRSKFSSDTNITSVNSGYLGVVGAVGSEKNLPMALVPSEFANANTTLSQKFARGILAGRNVTALISSLKNNITQSIMKSQSVSEQRATEIFYGAWATTPTDSTAEWDILGTLGQFPVNESAVSNVSSSRLWNASLSSLVNADDSTLLKWDDPTEKDRRQFMSDFSLLDQQLTQVLQWRADFRQREVTPALVALFGVSDLAGIGYIQWGQGSITDGVSIKDVVPALELDAVPEIALFDANSTIRFNIDDSKRLLGMFSSPTSVPQFLGYYARGMWKDINDTFGLDEPEADLFMKYISQPMTTLAKSTLEHAFATGGGLFSTRTAFDWIWGFQDPLLKALRFPNTIVKVMDNVTTIEEAERNANVSQYYTGKGDVDRTAQYIKWRGLTELAAGTNWPVDVPIRGTSGFQFHPFVKEKDEVLFFSEDLMRPFVVGFSEQVTSKGITLYRYHPIPEDFDPNPDFNQEIPGFANMSQTYGVPFFLSQPNFLNVPAEYSDKIVGMHPSRKDDTYVDIEPITGTVMDASKKLQVNMFLKNSTVPLDLYNADVPKGRFYPTLYIDETGSIDSNLADDFKDSVYFIVNVRTGLFWAFFLAGLLALLSGLLGCIFIGTRCRRAQVEVVGLSEETPVLDDVEE